MVVSVMTQAKRNEMIAESLADLVGVTRTLHENHNKLLELNGIQSDRLNNQMSIINTLSSKINILEEFNKHEILRIDKLTDRIKLLEDRVNGSL